MEDIPLTKVAISGPTLASLIQRISSSLGDVDGLLFGHVTLSSSPALTDDDSSSSSGPQITATITAFTCPSSSPLSFFSPLGRLLPSLDHLISPDRRLLGWFSGRRRSPLRPSMREFAVSHSLASGGPFPNPSGGDPVPIPPCVFLLLSTPLHDQMIHTHDYRAYQYRPATRALEARHMDVVNIGPDFRGHYGSFGPVNSGFFPGLGCELRGSSAMNVDQKVGEGMPLGAIKEAQRAQKEVDQFALGFPVQDLKRLVGPEASDYTLRLQDLYEKMLDKVEVLARDVEISNAKILYQENHNRKLRYRIARGGQAEP